MGAETVMDHLWKREGRRWSVGLYRGTGRRFFRASRTWGGRHTPDGRLAKSLGVQGGVRRLAFHAIVWPRGDYPECRKG